MWDLTARAVAHAIDGLAQRLDARADNIANAQTPGFRATHVDFESTLRDALANGRLPAAAERLDAPTIVNRNNNSVDLESEMVGALRDQLHRDAMVAAFNFKTGQLRAAITGQR